MTVDDYGFRTPQDHDLIRNGDDAITHNAERTAFWLDRITWKKTRLYGASDIENLYGREADGTYPIPTLSVAQGLNLPSPGTGSLTVVWMGSDTITAQIWHNTSANYLYTRTFINGSWSTWNNNDYVRGPLSGTDNADDFNSDEYSGSWRRSYTSTPGFPTDALGILQVVPSLYGCTQLFYEHASTAGVYVRTYVAGGSWQAWSKLGSAAESAVTSQEVGLTNQLLKEDFSRRHGGRVPTGGKGAIAFRFDHGLTNFAATIMPMLQARGIVASQALNSRTWDTAENNGATPELVNSWVAVGELEVWNHGATHTDPTTFEDLETEVITSLHELRAQLPDAQIDGWITPGVTSNGEPFLGMGAVNSVERLYNSVAGRMFLQHHAVVNGHVTGSVYRPLDGMIRQGQTYSTIDKLSLSSFQAQVDQAAATKRGIGFMMHPFYLDRPDYISTATLEAMLDYAVAKQDAGEIVILSPYQLMLADATI